MKNSDSSRRKAKNILSISQKNQEINLIDFRKIDAKKNKISKKRSQIEITSKFFVRNKKQSETIIKFIRDNIKITTEKKSKLKGMPLSLSLSPSKISQRLFDEQIVEEDEKLSSRKSKKITSDDLIKFNYINSEINELNNDKNYQNSLKIQENNKLKKLKTKREKILEYKTLKTNLNRKIQRKKKVFDSFSESEIIFKKSHPYVIKPHNLYKQAWDLIMYLLILYYSIYYPCKIAFDITFNSGFDNIVDLIFLIDTILNFFSAFHDENERLIQNLNVIAYTYLKNWLILDLITSIPLQILANLEFVETSHTNKINRYYFHLKWTRVLRVIKLLKKEIAHAIDSIIYKLSIDSKRFFFFIFCLLVMIHLSSCFFIYIGYTSINSDHPENKNWLTENSLSGESQYEIYSISIYFILETIFTVGYGDFVPLNRLETLFVILLLTSGCALFSYGLFSLGSVFKNSDFLNQQYIKKEKILRDIDKEFSLPYLLFAKLDKSIKFVDHNTNEEFMNFVVSLPSQIKNILFNNMYKDQIRKIKFFGNQPYDFIIDVIPLMKNSAFVKGDIIVGIGEFYEEMYIVYKGVLGIQLSEEYGNQVLALVKRGNHFGDIHMFSAQQPNYNLIVKSRFVQVLVLKKYDFAQIKLKFSNEINYILFNSLKTYKVIERRKKIIFEYFKKNKNSTEFKFKQINLKKEFKNNISSDKNGDSFNDNKFSLSPKIVSTTQTNPTLISNLNKDNKLYELNIRTTSEDINNNKNEERKERKLLNNLKVNQQMDNVKSGQFVEKIFNSKNFSFNKNSFSDYKSKFSNNMSNDHCKYCGCYVENKLSYIPKSLNELKLENNFSHLNSNSNFSNHKKSVDIHSKSFVNNIQNNMNNVFLINNYNLNYPKNSDLNKQKSEISRNNLNKKFEKGIFQPNKSVNELFQRNKAILNPYSQKTNKDFLDSLNGEIRRAGFQIKNEELFGGMIGGMIKSYIGKSEKKNIIKRQYLRLESIFKNLKNLTNF